MSKVLALVIDACGRLTIAADQHQGGHDQSVQQFKAALGTILEEATSTKVYEQSDEGEPQQQPFVALLKIIGLAYGYLHYLRGENSRHLAPALQAALKDVRIVSDVLAEAEQAVIEARAAKKPIGAIRALELQVSKIKQNKLSNLHQLIQSFEAQHQRFLDLSAICVFFSRRPQATDRFKATRHTAAKWARRVGAVFKRESSSKGPQTSPDLETHAFDAHSIDYRRAHAGVDQRLAKEIQTKLNSVHDAALSGAEIRQLESDPLLGVDDLGEGDGPKQAPGLFDRLRAQGQALSELLRGLQIRITHHSDIHMTDAVYPFPIAKSTQPQYGDGDDEGELAISLPQERALLAHLRRQLSQYLQQAPTAGLETGAGLSA